MLFRLQSFPLFLVTSVLRFHFFLWVTFSLRLRRFASIVKAINCSARFVRWPYCHRRSLLCRLVLGFCVDYASSTLLFKYIVFIFMSGRRIHVFTVVIHVPPRQIFYCWNHNWNLRFVNSYRLCIPFIVSGTFFSLRICIVRQLHVHKSVVVFSSRGFCSALFSFSFPWINVSTLLLVVTLGTGYEVH